MLNINQQRWKRQQFLAFPASGKMAKSRAISWSCGSSSCSVSAATSVATSKAPWMASPNIVLEGDVASRSDHINHRNCSECDDGGERRQRRQRKGRLSLPLSFSPFSHVNHGAENDNENNENHHSHHHNVRSSRIFIDFKTMNAIRAEVEAMPLPATLAAVAIALRSGDYVLDTHIAAGYSTFKSNNSSDKNSDSISNNSVNQDWFHEKFVAISSLIQEFHISPLVQEDQKRDAFKNALNSLVGAGTNVMLYTWEDVEHSLSKVFLFSSGLSLKAEQKSLKGNGMLSLEDDVHAPKTKLLSESLIKHQRTIPKTPPKKAHRQSPVKKAYASPLRSKPPSQKLNVMLSLEAYRQQIQNKIGRIKWNQIFHHSVIRTSQPALASAPFAVASRLDQQIQRKEQSIRYLQEHDEIIARKEKEVKEKEAQLRASSLLRPLSDEEQSIVQNAIYGIGPPTEILASLDADSVQRASMHRLQPGQWLNDEIINYFLKNCLSKRDEKLCAQQPGRRRSHFFNSFFVQNLFDEKNANYDKRGKYNYNNVKRWSKKVPGKDVFHLKYIICPINLDNMHWTSAVIFMEEKRIQYYDSLGGTDYGKLEGLLQYLKDEHKSKKGEELKGVEEWRLVGCEEGVPQQLNGKCVVAVF